MSRATYISVTLMLLVLLMSVCSSARCEDIFLETFGSDQELWDESYVWYRGEEPLYILESNTIPVIFDNEGSFTYYEYVETGRDTYWHLDGNLTVHSTAAVRAGQLYLRQFIKDGRPGENYFHGTNRVDMRKRIYIEAPITGLNHNSRLSMDLFLLDSGRFLQFGGSPWRHAEVSFRLYSPSGTLALGAWQVSDDASGNLIPIGSSMIESFEGFDVKINELLGYSEEEFDNKFGNDHSVTLCIEFNSHYEGSWDRWGYEGVYLECEFGNIRIYQPYGPTASFTYLPEKPMVGGNIIFDASDSVGEIAEYEWDWGDEQSEILTHAETSHVFETPGVYTVTLTVTDNDGLTELTSEELDLTLKKGDILLCRSDMSFVPAKEWTHAGVYIGNEQVVEAVNGKGVIISPLSEWNWPQKTYVKALRVNTNVSTREDAANFALGKVDQGYDVGKIFLQRLGLSKKQVDSNSWYCSELLWAAFKHASADMIDLDQNRYGNVVSPDEIDSDDEVEIVGEHKEEKLETLWCLDRLWGGVAYCPVDLIIHNPNGLVVSKDANEIPGAIYEEIDIDEDGETDDFFAIPNPKIGGYEIQVVPELNALPDDTYSLEAIVDDETYVLAEDTPTSEIPEDPYLVIITEDADLNDDGKVNFADFTMFAAHWLDSNCEESNNWCNAADLDTLGTVDIFDLALLAEHWLQGTWP